MLILGATGMVGHTLFRQLLLEDGLDVHAAVRTAMGADRWFPGVMSAKVHDGIDASDFDTVSRVFASVQPDIVVNCIGIIKQSPLLEDPVGVITINSLLPHRLMHLCRPAGVRLIQMSTDCVFSGRQGSYREKDEPDATDFYGRSKLLGEVLEDPCCLTMRKSMIGHEWRGKRGLIEWFLAQQGSVKGFTGAVFTGLPTFEMARILVDYVIPNENLWGLYNVGADPISKYELLGLVAERYGKRIEIIPDDGCRQDRSLNSEAFRRATGYRPPSWPELVDGMYRHYVASSYDGIS